MITCVTGISHPILARPDFWDQILGGIVEDSYKAVCMWDLIWRNLTELVGLRDRHGEKVSTNETLPEANEPATCHFSFFLEQASTGPLKDIKAVMAASPPLRNHFIRIPVEQGSSMFDVARKSDKKHYLLWLLLQLADNDEIFRCGLRDLIDEV